MREYQYIFAREEKKYLLDEGAYHSVYAHLKPHMRPDEYGKTRVCSLYLDTPDYRLIRASMEKPVYKEKLRLRTYGIPDAQSPAFLELKKKYRGIVYKRRVEMPLCHAMEFLEGRPNGRDGQIEREISWTLRQYPDLRPRMFLAYDRLALCGIEETDLRVTFDKRILWRDGSLELTDGVWGHELMRPGQRLMEIKRMGGMPLWLSHLLDQLRIYPTSYSKYANAYLAAQQCGKEKNYG